MRNSTKININISGKHFSIESWEDNIENILIDFINKKSDFFVKTNDISYATRKVENIIERSGYKSRVYAREWFPIIVGMFFAFVTKLFGGEDFSYLGVLFIFSVCISLLVYLLATYNPDYEIIKDYFSKEIRVIYKKSKIVEIKKM